jgi:hypothetical protein
MRVFVCTKCTHLATSHRLINALDKDGEPPFVCGLCGCRLHWRDPATDPMVSRPDRDVRAEVAKADAVFRSRPRSAR